MKVPGRNRSSPLGSQSGPWLSYRHLSSTQQPFPNIPLDTRGGQVCPSDRAKYSPLSPQALSQRVRAEESVDHGEERHRPPQW